LERNKVNSGKSRFLFAPIYAGITLFVWFCHQACLNAQENDKDDNKDIQVMSFNIRYGTARDGLNHWDSRKELVAHTIKSCDPDLVGLQETLPFQAEYLKQQLPGYQYFGWSRDEDHERGEQCGIMVRSDRFTVAKSGQFWLSETPDVKASKSWDSSLPRIATWLIIHDKNNHGQEIVILNTHFDHVGAVARSESSRLIKSYLAKNHPKLPLIVTGDFNCGASSKPYMNLVNNHDPELVDSFKIANAEKESGTFNGFKGEKKGDRIDWILVSSNFAILDATIDHTNNNGKYPSDHFPVTAKIRLKNR
jgi:endonuclease/exonuclease/phosphatase family metal-dependent hydrolase